MRIVISEGDRKETARAKKEGKRLRGWGPVVEHYEVTIGLVVEISLDPDEHLTGHRLRVALAENGMNLLDMLRRASSQNLAQVIDHYRLIDVTEG